MLSVFLLITAGVLHLASPKFSQLSLNPATPSSLSCSTLGLHGRQWGHLWSVIEAPILSTQPTLTLIAIFGSSYLLPLSPFHLIDIQILPSHIGPTLSAEKAYQEQGSTAKITNAYFEPANHMLRCAVVSTGVWCLLWSGDTAPKDVTVRFATIETMYSLQLVVSNSDGLKAGIHLSQCCLVETGTSHGELSACWTGAIAQAWDRQTTSVTWYVQGVPLSAAVWRRG